MMQNYLLQEAISYFPKNVWDSHQRRNNKYAFKSLFYKLLFQFSMTNYGHLITGLPDDIVKEEENLAREIEKEENEKLSELAEARKSEYQISNADEMRYKRLMCLLDRSKFYANFLLQRMNSKKEEEKVKVNISFSLFLCFYIHIL